MPQLFVGRGGVQILSFFGKMLQAMREGALLYIVGTCELLFVTCLGDFSVEAR